MSAWGLGRVITRWLGVPNNWGLPQNAAPSCLDRRHPQLDADDVDDARQIVGENAERHLGGDFRQCLCQEVRRAHARLDRALLWWASAVGGLEAHPPDLARGPGGIEKKSKWRSGGRKIINVYNAGP